MSETSQDPVQQLDLVWGAAAIAAEINRTERATRHLIAISAIKSVKKVAGRYCADRSNLRAEFRAA